ncbi:MAG: hypothetical protein WKF94_14835 [Solirubrobacteraceae bacterium]
MLAVMVVLALTGCAVPTSTGVTIPTYSPVREALSYFPSTAPVVAVVRTDPQDPGLRRLAGSGALAPLRRVAGGRGLHYRQLSGLLGSPAVIGQPRVGGAPLAVLATDDPDRLEVLAAARVATGSAAPAGGYRGADLYAEAGWAFAVRDRVLLASGSTRDLVDALDVRVGDDGFDASQFNDVLPENSPPATFARAYVDLEALVAGAPAPVRDVPVLGALAKAGVSVGATAEELRAVLEADTAQTGLANEDLPALEGVGGRRPAVPAGETALAVADLAPLAAAAERALRAALPVSALRLDAVRSRLRGAGVALTPELLAGPAVITDAPALRLLPARPALVREALARATRKLALKRDDGFYETRGIRFGFINGTFAAGKAPARALRRLARLPLTPLRSPFLLRVPRLLDAYPRPVVFTLGGSPERLTVSAFSGF